MPRRDDDRGVALITAILVMGVVVGLSLLITSIAVSTNRDSGRDRQRVSAIQVAEAQVDTTYASFQTATASLLPCNPTSSAVKTSPDAVSTVISVKYVYSDPAMPPSCPIVSPLPAGVTVTGAVIDSVATANQLAGAPTVSRRHMQSFVKLNPIYVNGLSKAIYAGGGFTSDNQTTLYGNGAVNADVFSNNSFVCSNNQSYDGNLYSQGNITMNQTCSVKGDVWAKGNVLQTGNAAMGGKVWSSGGSVVVDGQSSVTSSLKAAGAVVWPKCNAAKCFPNSLSSPTDDPPAEAFPVLNSTSTVIAYRNSGYTNYVEILNCTAGGGVAGWVAANGPSLPANTVIKTPCAVNFTQDIKIAASLAIFASGGFTASGIEFDSTSAAKHDLAWIVPFDAAARPCANPGISTAQQFSLTDKINMLLYSPCDINFENRSPHIGQIYSGSNLRIKNQFALQFRPVKVFGVANATAGDIAGYNVDIVYKREVA